ncbi:hypothetical protein AD998_11685 [bacterium 336/3]|nr:hypothetical protein AD998_11685 [bacterium 336/3]
METGCNLETIRSTIEYGLIKNYYADKKAERSGVLLINHIDEGLQILKWEKASINAMKAYCLHPMFQADEALVENYQLKISEKVTPNIILLVMEYRNIANQYLSKRIIENIEEIQLSSLVEVNQILVADKIQNRKDFEIYHKKSHPRAIELDKYFKNWLLRLKISEEKYQNYCQNLTTK